MGKIVKDNEVKFSNKQLIAQKKALVKYGEYLAEQLAAASKSEADKKHKTYIESQIVMNNKKIANIDAKL